MDCEFLSLSILIILLTSCICLCICKKRVFTSEQFYSEDDEFVKGSDPVNTIVDERNVKKAVFKLFIKNLMERNLNNKELFDSEKNLFEYLSNPPNTSTTTNNYPGLFEKLENIEQLDTVSKLQNSECSTNKEIYSSPEQCECQFQRGLDICFHNEYPIENIESTRTILFETLFETILHPNGVLNIDLYTDMLRKAKTNEFAEFVFSIDVNELFNFEVFDVKHENHKEFVSELKMYLIDIVKVQLSILQTKEVEDKIIKQQRRREKQKFVETLSEPPVCYPVEFTGKVDNCLK
jgi:hypothetical protein